MRCSDWSTVGTLCRTKAMRSISLAVAPAPVAHAGAPCCPAPQRPRVALPAQSWESVPAHTKSSVTFGSVLTSSTTNFLPTSARVNGASCAVVSS